MTFAVNGGNVLQYILFLRGVNVEGRKIDEVGLT